MKVLQLSHKVPWPLNDGGNIAIYQLTESLAKQGIDLTLWCLDAIKFDTPISQAEFELKKFGDVFIHPIDTSIKIDDAMRNIFSKESYNVERFYNGVFNTELIHLLKSQDFDVVHLESIFMGPYVDTIKEHFSGPIVLRSHNVEYEIWQRRAANEKNPVKAYYLRLLARRLKKYELDLMKKIDKVACISPDDEVKFKAANPDIVSTVIPAGISNFNESPVSYGFNKWYHLGSMEWEPNKAALNWFINSIHSNLLQVSGSYQLTIGGRSMEHYSTPELTRLKKVDNVPDAAAFINEQEVCVVPLQSGSGIRIKILEAMAAKKLVISTTVGAQGIDCITNEHLLIANTPEEFVEIFKKLQNGSINVKTIVDNAFQLIKDKYSQDGITQQLIQFYQA